MRHRRAAVIALAVAVVAAATTAVPASAADRAVMRAADYLRAAATPDGGFAEADAEAGTRADPLVSGWAVIGLAAAGEPIADRTREYLADQAQRVRDVGDMERTLLALHAAGGESAPLAERLEASLLPDGSWDGLTNRTAFGILALRAAGRPAPPAALRYLLGQQNRDGGWGLGGRGARSGIDDTAAVVQALAGEGRGADGPEVPRAIEWLRAQQHRDGGFPLTAGEPSNAQSTAFVVQALLAAGVDPGTVRRGGRAPLAYLRALQAGDGHVAYSRTSDQTPTWVTAQALAALAGKALPVAPEQQPAGTTVTELLALVRAVLL